MRPAALVLLASLAGCSLSSEGLGTEDPSPGDSATVADSSVAVDDTAPSDDTATDSGEPPPLDTSVDTSKPDTAPPPDTAKADTAPPPDTGPPCVETSCGANPTGAKRIGLGDRLIACPAGFIQTDIQEVRAGDACSCTCATTLLPTCPGAGTMPTWYSDGSATCATSGAALTSTGAGACSALGFSGNLAGFFRATPIPPTGGTCGTNVFANKAAASAPRRICESVTCAAPICTGTPWVECIEATTCGGAFPNQRIIGTDVTPACPMCNCTVSGTCTGSFVFYDNGSCGGASVVLAANDKCVAVPSSAPSISSLRYTSALTASACAPSYTTGKGTPIVTGQRSLCCR